MEASENTDNLQIEDLYKQKIGPLLQIDIESLPVETTNLFTQVGISDKVVDLIKASGNNKTVLILQGLPNLISALGIESITTKWDQLVDLGIKAGETSYDLFKAGLPCLVKSVGKDFIEKHWNTLVDVGMCTGPLAWAVYQHVIPSWKENFGEEYLENNLEKLTSEDLVNQHNIETIEKNGLVLSSNADDKIENVNKNENSVDTKETEIVDEKTSVTSNIINGEIGDVGVQDENNLISKECLSNFSVNEDIEQTNQQNDVGNGNLKVESKSEPVPSKSGSVNTEIYSLIKERGELIEKISELQKKTVTLEEKLVEMGKEKENSKNDLSILVKNLKLLVEENEPFTLSEDVLTKIGQEEPLPDLAEDNQNQTDISLEETNDSTIKTDYKNEAANVDEALSLLRKDLLKASTINKKLRSDLAHTKPSIKSIDDNKL